MSLHTWLNRIWYEDRNPPWWLRPWSVAYRGAFALRHWLFQRGVYHSIHLDRPVIVVGNLSVGGTGKTPLVLWLVARLRGAGRRPGIVTRGYGGAQRLPRIIGPADDPAVVGDEPLLLARRSGVPVAVGRDRPAAAQLLIEAGCDVVVSDDGLQHEALARDCEIVVVDAARRFGNGRLLPAGPLRELPERLGSVDAVVVNGTAGDTASDSAAMDSVFRGLKPFTMRLHAQEAVAVVGSGHQALASFAGTTVHAVAGIGNPQRFFDLVRAVGIEVIAHPLADHAPITGADILFTDRRPVLMTEKDAVKCGSLADERHWFVPVEAGILATDATALMAIVFRCIDGDQPGEGEVHGG
jgi:tetraacyldisaccharide 4'-kinase